MSFTPVGKVGAIGSMNARRFARDRMNLFFFFVFPIALILLIGLQFGGDRTPRLGVVSAGGPGADAVLAGLRSNDDVEIVSVGDAGDLAGRVESTDLDAGVVLPADLDTALAAGEAVEVGFVAGTSTSGQQLSSVVDETLARVAAAATAAQAAIARGADPGEAAATAARLAQSADRVEVRAVTTGERLFPEATGDYDVAAPSQLVLFLFLTGLTGSYALIQTRQLGLGIRMLSTPTSARTIILGEALGRWLIGIAQGVYIVLATMLLFGVDWGDAIGAIAVLLAIAAVSAGAAMCFGTLFRQPDQASGVGVIVALCLAALGGAMLPIELFSDTLASVARVTPHYWALDAFAELIRHDASILDIGTQLGMLAAYAAALLLLASWRMRIVLTRPA